jgi:DNA-directed RNA polymerase specialized sigma24 family protein
MRTTKTRSGRKPRGASAELDADHALTVLYQMHYPSLVRLAALLVPDLVTAEDIVQDAFAAVYGRWHTLPGTDAALAYLRRSVVHRSRSAPPPGPGRAGGGPGQAGSEPEASLQLPGSAVVSALRALPARQREVLVLRYFADLPEAEIALATGTRQAEVRSRAAQAMSSLRAGLPAAGE